MKDIFPPLAAFTYVAVTADASANKVDFIYPGFVHGATAQIFAAAGTENMTGLDVDVSAGKRSSTITVAVSNLAVGDKINILVW